MIININDICENGKSELYKWLKANAGGEIYSPDLEYGRYDPRATFERLSSRRNMYEKLAKGKDDPVRVVASGYGGFFGHMLHIVRYQMQTILIDPLLIPFAPMRLHSSYSGREAMARLMTDGFFEWEYGFGANLHVICTAGRDGGAYEEQIRCVLPDGFKNYYRVKSAGDLGGETGEILKKLLNEPPVRIEYIDQTDVIPGWED